MEPDLKEFYAIFTELFAFRKMHFVDQDVVLIPYTNKHLLYLILFAHGFFTAREH